MFAAGNLLPGSIALSDANRRITFTPATIFPASSNVTVDVGFGITDLADHLIDNPGSFSFQTGNPVDTVRASVVAVSPLNGAGNVPANASIQVQFSKRVDALTVTDGTLRVFPSGGNLIDGTLVVSADGQSATFTPSAPLVVSTTYLVQATSGITDLEGQGLPDSSVQLCHGCAMSCGSETRMIARVHNPPEAPNPDSEVATKQESRSAISDPYFGHL